MFRRAQAVVVAFAMAVAVLTARPAGSQTVDPAAAAAGKTFAVFLFDASPDPILECLTFDADGSFSSELFGSGTWQAIPFLGAAFWWAMASQPGVSSSELTGFAFPSAAVISGMAQRTLVGSGEQSSFGLFGFANPNCNSARREPARPAQR